MRQTVIVAAVMVFLGGGGLFRQPPTAIAANGGYAIIGGNNYSTIATVFWDTSTGCSFTSAAVIGCGITGLSGFSQAGTGVEGHALNGGTGVYGYNSTPTGIGVHGDVSGSGSAVYGTATGSGVAVYGDSASGTAVQARSTNGTALNVIGKAKFSRSGVVTVPSGTAYVTVTLAGVTASSMVIATAQQNTTRLVKAAVPGAGSFVIRLNGTAPAGGLKVAYFVLN
jgi:hypothetical protein